MSCRSLDDCMPTTICIGVEPSSVSFGLAPDAQIVSTKLQQEVSRITVKLTGLVFGAKLGPNMKDDKILIGCCEMSLLIKKVGKSNNV